MSARDENCVKHVYVLGLLPRIIVARKEKTKQMHNMKVNLDDFKILCQHVSLRKRGTS